MLWKFEDKNKMEARVLQPVPAVSIRVLSLLCHTTCHEYPLTYNRSLKVAISFHAFSLFDFSVVRISESWSRHRCVPVFRFREMEILPLCTALKMTPPLPCFSSLVRGREGFAAKLHKIGSFVWDARARRSASRRAKSSFDAREYWLSHVEVRVRQKGRCQSMIKPNRRQWDEAHQQTTRIAFRKHTQIFLSTRCG